MHRAPAPRPLPSSSSSAVMDLERSVRVVLGALLGGGGAERKRDGILLFLSRNLRGVARCRCHFFSTAWISSYSRDEESHCCRILLRLRVEANFFMVSVAQSGARGRARRRGAAGSAGTWTLPRPPQPSAEESPSHVPGLRLPPAATGDARAMKASRELNVPEAAGRPPVGRSAQLRWLLPRRARHGWRGGGGTRPAGPISVSHSRLGAAPGDAAHPPSSAAPGRGSGPSTALMAAGSAPGGRGAWLARAGVGLCRGGGPAGAAQPGRGAGLPPRRRMP